MGVLVSDVGTYVRKAAISGAVEGWVKSVQAQQKDGKSKAARDFEVLERQLIWLDAEIARHIYGSCGLSEVEVNVIEGAERVTKERR